MPDLDRGELLRDLSKRAKILWCQCFNWIIQYYLITNEEKTIQTIYIYILCFSFLAVLKSANIFILEIV